VRALHAVIRVLAALMALFFVYATAVQYNDPDPVRWMAVYVAALACCVSFAIGRFSRLVAAITIAAAAIWAAIWRQSLVALPQYGQVPWVQIEEARELGGLLIVAGWTSILLAADRFIVRKPGPATAS
jgi:hypothetical protein